MKRDKVTYKEPDYLKWKYLRGAASLEVEHRDTGRHAVCLELPPMLMHLKDLTPVADYVNPFVSALQRGDRLAWQEVAAAIEEGRKVAPYSYLSVPTERLVYGWEKHPDYDSYECRNGDLLGRVVLRNQYYLLYDWMLLRVDPTIPKFADLCNSTDWDKSLWYDEIEIGDLAGSFNKDEERLITEGKKLVDAAMSKHLGIREAKVEPVKEEEAPVGIVRRLLQVARRVLT